MSLDLLLKNNITFFLLQYSFLEKRVQSIFKWKGYLDFTRFYHGFKNQTGKRTGKESGSRMTSRTGSRTGDVINNLINNFKII